MMPIHQVNGGFQWGGRGKVYPTREGAARQARAAYANGYVGKSLVEIRRQSSVSKASSRDERKGAATGIGVAGIGAGLAGGGVPGLKATRLQVDVNRAPLHKKPLEFWRARRAGAFGQRAMAHSILINHVLTPDTTRLNAKAGSAAQFQRAASAGKVAPERDIVRHLKFGRKASHGLLAGGAGLTAYGLAGRRKKVEKADRTQEERDRRNAALIAGGGAGAAGSYGTARLLEHQGRKWSRQAAADFSEAQKIAPGIGGYKVRSDKVKLLGRTKVPNVRPDTRTKNIRGETLHGLSRQQIHRAGRLHGAASNKSYFGHVYGTMGLALRRVAVPAGVAAAGTGLYRTRRKEQVGKAYQPSYFQGSAPTERLHGQRQRAVAEGQRVGLSATGGVLAGASTVALGTRMMGHKMAPALTHAAGAAAQQKGVPKEAVKDLTRRAHRVHAWAAPRRGRLLVASGLTGAGAVGARAAARWKKDEVSGISHELGRASAGDRLQRGSRRFKNDVNKDLGTAVTASYGMKAAKKWADLSPKARQNIVRGTLVGSAGTIAAGGTVATVARGDRWHREHKKLRQAGGVTGPVMKSEIAVIGKATNLKDYDYLPENVREDVGYGSIGVRRNPMSALDLFAASRIMAESEAAAKGERVSRKGLTRRARNEMNYAGSRAMLYSPVGRGSVF